MKLNFPHVYELTPKLYFEINVNNNISFQYKRKISPHNTVAKARI